MNLITKPEKSVIKLIFNKKCPLSPKKGAIGTLEIARLKFSGFYICERDLLYPVAHDDVTLQSMLSKEKLSICRGQVQWPVWSCYELLLPLHFHCILRLSTIASQYSVKTTHSTGRSVLNSQCQHEGLLNQKEKNLPTYWKLWGLLEILIVITEIQQIKECILWWCLSETRD